MNHQFERPVRFLRIFVAGSLFVTAFATADAQQQRTLNFDDVHGRSPISLSAAEPRRIEWLDGETFSRITSDGRDKVHARTGESEPAYDVERLAEALRSIDGPEDAEIVRWSKGEWQTLDSRSRMACFRHTSRLIRASLEGSDISVVEDMPESAELFTFCDDGNVLVFVSDSNLFAADFRTKTLRQLTDDGTADIRNGKADWVYYEEVYHRNWKAFQVSPDGRSVLFMQFNDTQVPTFSVIDHVQVQQHVEVEHFPKAGETNPVVRLGVVSIADGTVRWLQTDHYPADDFVLTRFGWYPDSTSIWWYAQNRIQSKLDFIRTDASSLGNVTLFTDSNEAWVSDPGDPRFLSDGSFIFPSERTGWRHLYHVPANGGEWQALTSGDWEVRALHFVSADEQTLLVSGTLDSHIADNLYRISIVGIGEDPAEPVRITQEEGHHIVQISPDGELFVDTWSTVSEPTSVALRDSHGELVRMIHSGEKHIPADVKLGTVEIRPVPAADDATTDAIFVYPPDFDQSQRYPVWLRSYGGPHSPNVRNAWQGGRIADHLLAAQGIVVIRFDPRSASGRGAQSAWLAYKKLGVEETRDVVVLCDWLAEQAWVDADRIGMNGHSYGGYLTAYAMTHCDKLCAGIAGAPVTAWENYDTIYTERYMSTPQDNPGGYREASVVEAAQQLHGRLLILHGLRDDNVHPSNAFQLVHALQQANKPFELMVYPRYRHGIYGSHYDRLTYDFIVGAMSCSPQDTDLDH